jgi:hypothetical protein
MESGRLRGEAMIFDEKSRNLAKEIAKQTEAEIMASAGRQRAENMIKESQRIERQKELLKRANQ